MTPYTPVSIPSSSGDLFGTFHPADNSDLVAVMCPPFGEEKKTSYRTYRATAEALASNGIPSLRFDYWGTGDSPGRFEDADTDIWVENIDAASRFARSEAKTEKFCLIGLRLGGTLAAVCECDHLVLWQPMLDTSGYLKENLKRQAVRQKIIDGGSEGGALREIDGYPLSESMIGSIKELKPVIDRRQCLVIQASYTDKILPEYVHLADKAGITLEALRMEPFWNRIGLVDTSPLIDITLRWISQR